jgi:hypothetical protein
MDPASEPAAPEPAAHPAAPAALRFPTTPRSRFNAALVRRHFREATEFARRCQRTGEPLLDPCGPRGDLYFLLKALVEQPEGRAHAAPAPAYEAALESALVSAPASSLVSAPELELVCACTPCP